MAGNSSGLDYAVGGVRLEDPGSKFLLANSIVSGNSNAAVLGIAERAASLIAGKQVEIAAEAHVSGGRQPRLTLRT